MATQNCFVYGTLMYPEVLQALLNRVPRKCAALIKGHQRYCIQGQVFPGTIASTPDSQVHGLVLFDLTPEELEVFDEFEGDEYTKVGVAVELLPQGCDSGSTQQALEPCSVYLWRDDLQPLLHGEWDAEAFRETHLPAYVEMCRRFAAELLELRRPDSRPFNFQ